MPEHHQKHRFSTSLIVGVLLVPLSAVAAFGVVGRSGGEAGQIPAVTDNLAPTTLQATLDVPATPTVTAAPVDRELARACGRDGRKLVALEGSGEISDVQQAALDALRPICNEAGKPLDAGRSSNSGGAVTAMAPTAAPGDDDGYEDDENENENENEYDDDHDSDSDSDHDDDHDSEDD
jgi:hypothetical protein